MNMQDKDLDQLFRSKLDGFEAEPAARVWENINRELGGSKQRKSLVPVLRIAATVAVVVAAGLFFLPKKQQQGTDQPKPVKLAVNPVKNDQDALKPDDAAQRPTTATTQVRPVTRQQPTQQIASVVNKINASKTTITATPQVTDPAAQNIATQPQQAELVAAVETKVKVSNPVVPDVSIIDRTITPVKQDVLAAATNNEDNNTPIPAKKHRIRGLGGLINTVVAAVDKREDKIIEFTDTDEGDSVTGINLGIIKVKKQK